MKKLLLFSAIVALVLAPAGTTAATPRVVNVNTSITGSTCFGAPGTFCGSSGFGSCLCPTYFWGFAGRAVIAKLGAFSFTGLYEYSDVFHTYTDEEGALQISYPVNAYRVLTLKLTKDEGDTLALAEQAAWTWTPPETHDSTATPQTWTVDETQNTGRFVGYTGSGTYDVTLGPCSSTNSEGQCTGLFFTLALDGTLTRPE
jgi:hypothetical protein